ncbi:MAG: hypothetical protein HY982_03070 [Candidatus Magasanikbacteria bacterium]|nr:hypothetical protein [Candidatus Magasanikbacteria bacterium]
MAIFEILRSILGVLNDTWWIFLPILLFFALRDAWLVYVTDRYIKKIEWVLLEIKVPKDILKTPKAMEQIFAAMYANYSHGIDFWMRSLDGWVDLWYSFEMVGYAGGIHFYVWTAKKLRNSVEAAIYSQYPDAEIHEVEDYMKDLPEVLPNESWDLYGTDLILKRESYYPIRTYPYFEEAQEEKRLDPLSALAEVMANLKGEERLWWQVIVCPSDHKVGNNWQKEGEDKINEVVGRKTETKKTLGSTLADWARNLVWAPVEHPVWPEGKTETMPLLKFLSPAEQEVVKAIDGKISKLGFETMVRFVYVDKKDVFTSSNFTAVMGALRQFNTQNLNSIGPDKELTIVADWRARFIPFYQRLELFSRKKKIFSNYKVRRLDGKMLGKYRPSGRKIHTWNVEELATIYHFPTLMVGAPTLRLIESKKGEPPVGLPIE